MATRETIEKAIGGNPQFNFIASSNHSETTDRNFAASDTAIAMAKVIKERRQKTVKQDSSKVFNLYKKLAKEGNAEAQYNLGVMHDRDDNTKEAIKFWQKAATQGYAPAQYALGVMYHKGLGNLSQSYFEAFAWWKKAAEQGYGMAQYNLALLYSGGYGNIPRSYKEAEKWYRKAAEQGFKEAQSNLASLYATGRVTDSEDYKEAKKWYRKAAKQGDALAQASLGAMYSVGLGFSKNPSLAYMWLSIAKNNGNIKAKKYLEDALKNMDKKDIEKGKKLMKLCIDSNFKNCPE